MKLPHKLLYSMLLLGAIIVHAIDVTMSPALTKQEVLKKIIAPDSFPHIIHEMQDGCNKVTFDPQKSSYAVKFNNTMYDSSVFAINAAGTLCAWDNPTGVLEWRSLTIANLVTRETITKEESHHGKLTQLYINDTGDLFIGDQLTNILLFRCNFNEPAKTIRTYIMRNKQQESRLLGASPTGNIFAITFPPDEVDLYQLDKELSTKAINTYKKPGEKISHVCFTSDDKLIIVTDSTIGFTNPEITEQTVVNFTHGSIKHVCRTDNPDSVIVIIENNGVEEFRQITLNKENIALF